MPEKQKQEAQAEQSERFVREAQRLIDAGDLNPTEAAEVLNRLLGAAVKRPAL